MRHAACRSPLITFTKKKRRIGVMRLRFESLLFVMALLLWLPVTVEAQSRNSKDLATGKLLVASRDFPDPSFAKSVVLVVKYDEDGTVGLIINRRSKVPISRALEQFKPAGHRSDPVYIGGPVNLSAILALLKSGSKPDDAIPVLGDVYLVSTRPLLEKTLAASAGPGDFHAFVGYCGWGRGQLEGEMKLGVWYLFNADAKQVFDSDPDSLWSRLVSETEQIFVRAWQSAQ